MNGCVYLIKNQHSQYYSKTGEWVNNVDTKNLFRTPHEDEIVNLKVELSVKDPSVRVNSVKTSVLPNGNIDLSEQDDMPDLVSEITKQNSAETDLV